MLINTSIIRNAPHMLNCCVLLRYTWKKTFNIYSYNTNSTALLPFIWHAIISSLLATFKMHCTCYEYVEQNKLWNCVDSESACACAESATSSERERETMTEPAMATTTKINASNCHPHEKGTTKSSRNSSGSHQGLPRERVGGGVECVLCSISICFISWLLARHC